MAKLIGVLKDRPHIAHVAVTVKEQRIDGGRADRTVEIPVRKEIWDSLKTAAQKEAYAQECAEFHSAQGLGWQNKRNARRKIWDDDDKARVDAAAAKAKAVAAAADEEARQAELAKLIVTPAGFVAGENGAITGVQVTITHQGYTCSAVIDPDPATKEANALAAWTASKAAADAQAALLASFAIG